MIQRYLFCLQGPVRFYDNERKACILLKQFQSNENYISILRYMHISPFNFFCVKQVLYLYLRWKRSQGWRI